MKKKFLIPLVILFAAFTGVAQNQTIAQGYAKAAQATSFTFQRIIQFNNQSAPEEVTITIEEGTQQFDLLINTAVDAGKLSIEIYDANNKRQGKFSVGTQLQNNSEQTMGSISKSLLEPTPGDWVVRMIPLNAKGRVQIDTKSLL